MALSKVTYTDATHLMTKWKKQPYSVNLLVPQLTDTQINSMQDEIIVNAAAIAAVEASTTPAAGVVTNAMMATDAKIGSLAALTTTIKTSVQGAINELDAEIGNVASLTTTDKTVVGAINEIDADNAGLVSETGAQTLTNKTLTSPVLNTAKIGDGDAHCTITSADQTHADATATIPNFTDAADEFVMKDTAQTLTLKTLTAPVMATIYQDAGKTQLMTLPNTASDTLCAIAATQTLTNKTLTLPKIATTGAIVDAGGDEYLKFVEATTPVTYVQITSGDTGVAPKVQGAGETNTDLHLLGSGTGNVKVSDGTDPTKLAVFELNGATTAKATTFAISHTDDRTIAFPDATCTLVGKDTTDVFTNKSMTEPQFTYTLSAHDYAAGATDWTLSAAELLKYVHKPTNANAPVNAIVSTTIREYMFINSTGQSLVVKTAAGTGITIASTKVAKVFCDGVNVIRITTDA